MKTILALTVLLNASAVLANKVSCVDEKSVWEATFELDEKNVHNLEFSKNGVVYKEFGTQELISTVIKLPFSNKGFIASEVNLGGSKYLNFERNFKGNEVSKNFHATFLLTNNPFGFEKHIDCIVTE